MTKILIPFAQSQRGFSKLGLLCMLIVLVSALTFGLKVLPVYIDHNFVRGVAETLVESGRANSMTQTELREEIAGSMRVNNVRDFDLEAITSTRTGGKTVIRINYEQRIALVGNIDIIISFDEQIQ
jgi:predicted lipid carrier protein YhbT